MDCCEIKETTIHSKNRSAETKEKRLVVALAGNPNCGKTTLFNALTGSHQKVGNYAGVTVQKKEGLCRHKGWELVFCDLPGTYSLSAYSMDEMLARDFVVEERPDLIVNVLDSTNLTRNLYLSVQFMELGIPMIGVLNMSDQAEDLGLSFDLRQLQDLLGMPFVRTVGTKAKGINDLLDLVVARFEVPQEPSYGAELEAEILKLGRIIGYDCEWLKDQKARWIALKLLEKDQAIRWRLAGGADSKGFKRGSQQAHSQVSRVLEETDKSIRFLEGHFGRDSAIVVSEQRYAYIRGALREATSSGTDNPQNPSEKIDKVLLSRVLGLPLFLLCIWGIFQLTFVLGSYPSSLLQDAFSWLGAVVSGWLPDGSFLKGLVVDGMIGGVGAVFGFIPLVVILFVLIAILEDLGYMARAAFLMDKFLHVFGLHGQSFLPMMLGFGCSVPAIMAARTLKSPKDRILTILIVPFMSCGAKLPVHLLLAATFFPKNAANVVMIIYVIGVLIALVAAKLLRAILMKGKLSPFVMELPPYRLPTLKGIGWHVVDKTWMYVKRAGTTILAASILIWFLTNFPTINYKAAPGATAQESAAIEQKARLEGSLAGQFGQVVEPVLRPLGFDWKIGVAMVSGFAAKEVIVSTMGVLYKAPDNGGSTTSFDQQSPLQTALKADPVFNPLVAFTLMLFTLLATPCIATLATIRAEIGTRWLLVAILLTLTTAWIASFGFYQIGLLCGLASRGF